MLIIIYNVPKIEKLLPVPMQHIQKKKISVPDAAHIEAVYIVPKIETLLLVLRILYTTHPYGRLVRHHDAA